MKPHLPVLGFLLAAVGLAVGRHAPLRITAPSVPRVESTDSFTAGPDSLRTAAPGHPSRPDQPARLESEDDPVGALAAAARLPEPERHHIAETAIALVARTDPASALEAAALFQVFENDGRAEHIIQLWTESEPAAALAWVTAQPPSLMRDRLAARVIWVHAQHDPVAAAALAPELLAPSPIRDQALLGIVRHWARRDPLAAVAWVAAWENHALRTRAVDVLAQP